ncbi:hypothetical protein HW130_17265 [Streptomyces sp. PKU-EA00015]|uniref:hypothetical protein n=1 Tax=Streptomyces sp. PKU-EA00015 TaxID=2748326 RepID=UPI0015A44E5C|nr:hypothetical protein [Streptomyces sp. PKU-EA00015]NWF27994.1 hypothetical protein [Streptomyces sp. PKU-EA00015]
MATKEELIAKAADLVNEYAENGMAGDPHKVCDAMKAVLDAGGTHEDIAAYNRARRRETQHQ